MIYVPLEMTKLCAGLRYFITNNIDQRNGARQETPSPWKLSLKWVITNEKNERTSKANRGKKNVPAASAVSAENTGKFVCYVSVMVKIYRKE